MTSKSLAFAAPLTPHCLYLRAVSTTRETCSTGHRRSTPATTALRSTTFLPSHSPRSSFKRSYSPCQILDIKCQEHKQESSGEEHRDQSNKYIRKFDPTSETDAFGRDPRKETQFWMGAARSILQSEEVQDAIAKHAADGGDGLTEEQRAYAEFIKSMDADKASRDAELTDADKGKSE